MTHPIGEAEGAMEAIILAGGLGTRLKSVVAELPKAMAPIGDRPFLELLLDALADAGFGSVILAVGYRYEAIRAHFGKRYRALRLDYSVETTPLGTGGAIRLALGRATSAPIFVLNGDTYVQLDFHAMRASHLAADTGLTVAVQPVADTGRYGALEVEHGRIRGFAEKGRRGSGLINAGAYLLDPALLTHCGLPAAFSFESDFLVPAVKTLRPLAYLTNGLFIDIGTPDDYARAQRLLGHGAT